MLDIIDPIGLCIKQNCVRKKGYGLDYGSPRNTVTKDVAASWCGHASGPKQVVRNPNGLGDRIDGSLVSFKPFLTIETI